MTLLDLAPTLQRSPRLVGLPVAIIGAGPVGLAAAAHLVERGIEVVLLESGPTPAAGIASWRHIRLFSPWEHLVDPAARRLLEASGWTPPSSGVAPYAGDLVDDYLAPLAALSPIASSIRTGTTVVSVSREGMDRTRSLDRAGTPFVLRLATPDGVSELAARAVIDASGTYNHPNSLGSSGLDPLGYDTVGARISAALPDVLGVERPRFAGRHTVVVGAGHSAANTLIDLARLARDERSTRVTWLIRNSAAARVSSSDADGLPGRASLGQRVERLIGSGAIDRVDGFEIVRLSATDGGVAITGRRSDGEATLTADIIVNATGFRPNLDMLREIRLDLDEVVEAPRRLAPLIDPNVHSCGTVEPHGFAELQQPEPNFFLAGMKSYGRAPTFLLATGYEQVRSIAAWLDGDLAAASSVRLQLPATGVCSTGVPAESAAAVSAAPAPSCCS
ncbi:MULTISPECIES: FAD-dependent oxidoreductase [unclassified Leifsonia]|uniref:FAD-dependent oxidoreductase n=1 Tax=unclassified Leifsonia TaxID=2663824 RepID=UPI0006F65A48|nr:MULTISPECIES: FAD-dependent oxidoreductase [unclassified Leifsonia]KQX05180.1 flavoprotein [Leifsonia sp. Root1293]KRA08813.1 flavoprotein [Leifsonia sp. Root60]